MTVFYRKYRPQKFADLVGQDHVKKTLLAQLESGKIGHGYLFAGPRGTGKTSTARILAKAVNCQGRQLTKKSQVSSVKGQMSFTEPCDKCHSCLSVTGGSHLDLIEIDAASNRGIDEIRDLREKVKLSPVSGRFKVYIIDEAHMLTTEAFNALLKTLEEPPRHAIFILCTTEPGKLPATIISRLQRFNFSRAKSGEILVTLEKIAKNENVKIEKDALSLIARYADGSYRDAISIFDQLSASGEQITQEDVRKLALSVSWNQVLDFVANLANKDLRAAVLQIDTLAKSQVDIEVFVKEVILLLEQILFLKVDVFENMDLDSGQFREIKELSSKLDFEDVQQLMKLLLVAESEMKIYPLFDIPLVLAACKYCQSAITEGTKENSAESTEKSVEVVSETPKESSASPLVVGKPKINKSKSNSTAAIEQRWSEFLSKVRDFNIHVVALLRSTRPVGFDGVDLTLEVFYKFHKEKLEELKVLRTLEGILEKIMGGPIKLRFVLAVRETKLPETVAASDVIEVEEKDLEKIASEIFSK